MPLRWSKSCKGPVTLRQSVGGGQGYPLQWHKQGFATTSRLQHSIDGLTPTHLRRDVGIPRKQRQSRLFVSPKPQSRFQTSAGSANNDDATSGSGGHQVITEDVKPSLKYPSSKLERKRTKFATLEKGKGNRYLVNQLLKDKGHLSYNWRVSAEMLENQYLQSKADPLDSRGCVVRKIVPNFQSENKYGGSELVHRVRVHNLRHPKLATEVKRPSVWSEMNLAFYVEDLVNSEYRKNAMPYLKRSQDKRNTNLNNVISVLDDIFESPTTKRYLSTRTYKTALCFYYDIYMFSKARALYIQWEASNIDIPSDVFNTVLRGATSSKDLHNFTFILQKCLQRGFQPDIETWNAFLTCIESEKVRAIIIRRMREMGMLDIFAKSGYDLRMIVQQEISSRIEQYTDQGAFLRYMDECYGKKWLTTSTGNKLLHEFGKLRSMSETLDLLSGMKLRGWKADEISLNTLLRQTLLLRQNKHTIDVLETFRLQFGLRPGKQAHETLFLLARRSRLLNFARVVWLSACIHGHTTFSMRKFLSQSMLSKETMVQALDGESTFNKLAGEFVVGFNRSKEMVAYGSRRSFESWQSFTRRSSQVLLKSDLLAADGRYLHEDLEKLLLNALELDLKSNLSKTPNVQQLFDNGLQIPLRVPDERLIRRCISDEPQEVISILKLSTSVAKDISIQHLSRPSPAPSFRKVHLVHFARNRSLRIRKLQFSAKARKRHHLYIRKYAVKVGKLHSINSRRVRGLRIRRSMSSYKAGNPQSPIHLRKHAAKYRKLYSINSRRVRGLRMLRSMSLYKARNSQNPSLPIRKHATKVSPRRPRLYMPKHVTRESQKVQYGEPLIPHVMSRSSNFVPRLQSLRLFAQFYPASHSSPKVPTHSRSGELWVENPVRKICHDSSGKQTQSVPSFTQQVEFGEVSARDPADNMPLKPSAPSHGERPLSEALPEGLMIRIPLRKFFVVKGHRGSRTIFPREKEVRKTSPENSAGSMTLKLPAPLQAKTLSSELLEKGQINRNPRRVYFSVKPRARLRKHLHNPESDALIRKQKNVKPQKLRPLTRMVMDSDEVPSQDSITKLMPKLLAPRRARRLMCETRGKGIVARVALRKHFTAKSSALIRRVDPDEARSQGPADNATSKLPAPLRARKILSIRSKNRLARTIIRKHLAAETDLVPNAKENSIPDNTMEEPVVEIVRKDFGSMRRLPIRKFSVRSFTRHAVAPKSREPPIDSEVKPLPASVETAHLHSSLDKVLGLFDEVDMAAAKPAQVKPSRHRSRTSK